MVSDTSPSGVCAASTIYDENYEAWRAFDGDNGTSYWHSSVGDGQPWIQYQFSEAKTILSFSLSKAGNEPPLTFKLLGTNDNGNTLTELGSYSYDWVADSLVCEVTNPGSYLIYRIQVLSASTNYCQMDNIQMYETSSIIHAPTSFTATPTLNTISLSWDAMTNAESYSLYQSDDSQVTWNLIYSGSNTSYDDTGLLYDTMYDYKIVASGTDFADSDPSYTYATTAEAPLDTPSNFLAIATGTSISLDWDNVTHATHYTLQRLIGETWTNVTGYNTTSSNATDNTSISLNTRYYYRVKAIANNYTDSDWALFDVWTKVNAPTGLAQSGATISSITMLWDAVDGAISYNIYLSNGVTYDLLAGDILTNSYEHTGLAEGNGVTKSYKVSAVTASDEESSLSGAVSGTSSAMTQLDAPTGLISTNNLTSITISWDVVPNATSYKVYRNLVLLDTISQLSYEDTGLDSGTSYSYKIIAIANHYFDSDPTILSFVTLINYPSTFAASADGTSIDLSWDAASSASAYKIRRSKDENTWTILTSSCTDTTYRSSGLSGQTVYYYQIATINSAGEAGPYSSSVNAETAAVIGRRLVVIAIANCAV